MAKPFLPNINPIIQAGIDPKTGLPIKLGSNNPSELKTNIKRFLRLIDEQDAINRYKWYNLPCNLSGRDLERLLYFKGQLCFFYNKTLDEFYFMPYALEGGLDFYGRFKQVHPVPLNSSEESKNKALSDYLSTIKLNVQYGVAMYELEEEDLYNSCVLLHDYSKQLSETIIPRCTINDCIIDAEAECPSLMRTALFLSTGVNGVRVNNADEYMNVLEGAKGLENAALTGKPWVPITAAIDFQELAKAGATLPEQFMVAMQSLDNLRLSGYGLDNGGLFQKKAHMLQAEQELASPNVGLVYQDGLSIRQEFCNIVNSIWGLGIWCEASETQVGDINGNGLSYDQEQPQDNMDYTEGDNEDVQ